MYCIRVGDVHDRMIFKAFDIVARAIGMAPVGALEKCPPLAPVAQVYRMLWRREHQRTCEQHVRERARIILRVGRDLGKRHMAGRANEFLELTIGYRMTVDPEVTSGGAMCRRFLRVMLVGSHAEGAARDLHHAVTRVNGTFGAQIGLGFKLYVSFHAGSFARG